MDPHDGIVPHVEEDELRANAVSCHVRPPGEGDCLHVRKKALTRHHPYQHFNPGLPSLQNEK